MPSRVDLSMALARVIGDGGNGAGNLLSLLPVLLSSVVCKTHFPLRLLLCGIVS